VFFGKVARQAGIEGQPIVNDGNNYNVYQWKSQTGEAAIVG